MDPDVNEIGSIYYSYDPYFLVFLTGDGCSWERFSHSSGGTKFIRCKDILIVIN